MSFYHNAGKLREWGRKCVLPIEKIKRIVESEAFQKYEFQVVVDFGAGTMFWTKWLREKTTGTVYAVDRIYDRQYAGVDGVKCITEINDVPADGGVLRMFFACDVLHHLSNEVWDVIKEDAYRYDCVVIKDIDCHYRFKNFMNKMHDRLINGEKIRNINPDILLDELRRHGYAVKFYNIHKLWYSHFIIIGKKRAANE